MTLIGSWRRVLSAGAVVALGIWVAVLPAGAEKPTATGWWWRGRPSAMFPALLSPVPPVPARGLYVAGDLSGRSGISALRFQVDPDARVSTLTLTVAEASGTVAIRACVAKSTWKPAENGGWDQRPEADCEAASVTGAVDKDQTKVSFSLSALQGDDGVIDLVLVPGVDPASQNPANFSASFEPPGPDALKVSEPPKSSSPSSDSDADAMVTPALGSSAGGWSTAPLPASGFSAPALASVLPTEATPLIGGQPRTFTTGFEESFSYPAVLALPLLLLCAGCYLGWALTRPINVASHLTRAPS